MTGFHSNIEEVITHFQSLVNDTGRTDFSDALKFGVNAAMAEMQVRIFNKGLDSNSVSLGKYKGKKKGTTLLKGNPKSGFLAGKRSQFTPYELKRLKAGRQVNYKDLEFTGDLRKGIIVVKESGTLVSCSIINNKLILISEGQEDQLKTEIFSLSDHEKQILIDNTSEALKQLYVRIFNIS